MQLEYYSKTNDMIQCKPVKLIGSYTYCISVVYFITVLLINIPAQKFHSYGLNNWIPVNNAINSDTVCYEYFFNV